MLFFQLDCIGKNWPQLDTRVGVGEGLRNMIPSRQLLPTTTPYYGTNEVKDTLQWGEYRNIGTKRETMLITYHPNVIKEKEARGSEVLAPKSH